MSWCTNFTSVCVCSLQVQIESLGRRLCFCKNHLWKGQRSETRSISMHLLRVKMYTSKAVVKSVFMWDCFCKQHDMWTVRRLKFCFYNMCESWTSLFSFWYNPIQFEVKSDDINLRCKKPRTCERKSIEMLIKHVACRQMSECVFLYALLLLESFSYRGVGHVDLLVNWAGGSELLPGVGGVQVPPQVRQRVRDAEISVFQTHHLQSVRDMIKIKKTCKQPCK